MGINSIEFNQKLTQELDKALVQRSVTGIFADNNLRAKFVGTKTVLIPEVNMQALGDYDRDTGFVEGSVSVSHKPYELSQDRGRSFQIDREDADESGIADLMGKVAGEFVRTKAIPEMDAYVLSKLAQLAQANAAVSGTPANDALKMLTDAINKAHQAAGYDEELVAFVDGTFDAALQSSPDITRYLSIGEFKKGEITTKVKMFNGVPLIPVQNDRMKTKFVFNDGTTSGQEAGGFKPANDAKSIGLMVLPKKAANLVKKTEKTRTFSPDQNLKADAYKLDYRLYYDVFTKASYTGTVFAYTY